MQIALSMSAGSASQSMRGGASARSNAPTLEPIHPGHPQRAACERFIGLRFERAYGARVAHFSPHLLGVRDALGRWRAAAGYTPADRGHLFLEQYLDAPVEQVLGQGRGVGRASIVEVGNLAATSAGMGRALIPLVARHLHRLGYDWVVFTATRELRNSFARLGLVPLELARADRGRLADGGRHWGTYYNHDPRVVAGRVRNGLAPS